MGAARNIRRGAVGFRSERGAILTALMLTTGLIAIDATILATAVPSVVADLGQFDQFPWLFSVYLLAQAVSVPIYSKLADTLGRKPVVLAGIGLFLLGSILSGVAWTMTALIVFRVVQGLGAGAAAPMAMTIIGDIYTVEERALVQGYIASVWAEPPLTLDLMADWTRTVSSLVTIRRALSPISPSDPIALLPTAATGAARTADLRPVLAPSLGAVSAALADVGQDMPARPDFDQHRAVATLNHVAYELAHWVRVRTPDDRAKAWLQAGETALDGAIHAPTSRSAAGVGLAAWRDALAGVQPVQNAPIVRRSLALGHLSILRDTHALVDTAAKAGALPGPYADELLGSIRELARAHQTTLSQIDGRRLGATRIDQAVMLQVGTAVRQLTGRPEPTEPLHVGLDVLLRSGLGQAVLVANLTGEPSAHPAAARISRLSLE